MDNYRKYLEQIYAKNLAKAESREYYNGYYEKDLKFYEYSNELMERHRRFLKYMYSTFPKYIIQRNIIIYYYKSINCSISILNKSVAISRTSLKKIVNDSVAEGWVYTKVNNTNRRQVLVFPTKLRIKFWLLYCKNRYQNEIETKLDKARDKLKEYDNFTNKRNIFDKKILKEK